MDSADYRIDCGMEKMDFARVTRWLAGSYWSPGISRDAVEKAARGSSLVVGAFAAATGKQVGYLRVISDCATFAWLADVWVDAAHRRRGVAQAMVRFAQEHPAHQNLRRWMLVTDDAHALYQSCGFAIEPEPQRVMTYRPPRG